MSTNQTVTIPVVGEQIRHIFESFHTECSEWESDFKSLFDDIDGFLDDNGGPPSASLSTAEDLAGLARRVEQQTNVLTALVHAVTGQSPASDSSGQLDDQLDSVLGQLTELQHLKSNTTD